MVSAHYLETCLSQLFHISHAYFGLGEGLTSSDFVFFMSKVNVAKVTFVKECKHGFCI